MNTYKKLIDQIKSSVLTIAWKCSGFNNISLAKILHHFFNTRLSEICIESMGKILISLVIDLLKLYKSTAQLATLLPRGYGGCSVIGLQHIMT